VARVEPHLLPDPEDFVFGQAFGAVGALPLLELEFGGSADDAVELLPVEGRGAGGRNVLGHAPKVGPQAGLRQDPVDGLIPRGGIG
jgi:hypothetical protein